MGLALLAVALVWLAGLTRLDDRLTLPARHWNPDNLARVQSVSKNPLSFAVFGDSRNGPRVFGRLLAQASRDPDLSFAVHLGDLVPDGQVKHYALFFRQVRQHLKMPLLTVAGNHEYDKNGRGLYREIFGPPNYAFSLHHAYFIMLDNAARAVLDPEQLSWLEKELKKAQGYKHRLVFLHVPLFDPRVGEKPHALPEAAGRQLLALFQEHRVTHVFAGHIHGYFSGEWGGVPFTISGGAGVPFHGEDPNHYFHHYVKVSLMPEGLKTQVARLAAD